MPAREGGLFFILPEPAPGWRVFIFLEQEQAADKAHADSRHDDDDIAQEHVDRADAERT